MTTLTYPPDFAVPQQKQATAHVAAAMIAGLARRRRRVVQAGGCSGLWPLALAHYFDHVLTYEPEPTNWRCLQTNIAGTPNITARAWALGDRVDAVGLTRPKAGAGLWRVSGAGDIPMVPLDVVLEGTPIDALVLDVEGSEVAVWEGASRLIATHRPLLWFEHLQETAAIDAWLAAHGYGAPQRGVGGDCYSVFGEE